jgi:hypothetical protein
MQGSDKIYFYVLEGLISKDSLIEILHESMLLKIKRKVKTFQKIMILRHITIITKKFSSIDTSINKTLDEHYYPGLF